jgi:hypothetical protein
VGSLRSCLRSLNFVRASLNEMRALLLALPASIAPCYIIAGLAIVPMRWDCRLNGCCDL